VYRALGIHPALISKEGPLMEKLTFFSLISGLIGRPEFKVTFVSVGAP
jgi:hypothetical protein